MDDRSVLLPKELLKSQLKLVEDTIGDVTAFPDLLVVLFRLGEAVGTLSLLSPGERNEYFSTLIQTINTVRFYYKFLVDTHAPLRWSGYFFSQEESARHHELKAMVPLFQNLHKGGEHVCPFIYRLLDTLDLLCHIKLVATPLVESPLAIHQLNNIFIRMFARPALLALIPKRIIGAGRKIIKSYYRTMRAHVRRREQRFEVKVVPLLLDSAMAYAEAQAGLALLESYHTGRTLQLRPAIRHLERVQWFLSNEGIYDREPVYSIEETENTLRGILRFCQKQMCSI